MTVFGQAVSSGSGAAGVSAGGAAVNPNAAAAAAAGPSLASASGSSIPGKLPWSLTCTNPALERSYTVVLMSC